MRLMVIVLLICGLFLNSQAQDKRKAPWETGETMPAWGKFKPAKATRFEYQKGNSPADNGERLR